jgi:hypothetical protein
MEQGQIISCEVDQAGTVGNPITLLQMIAEGQARAALRLGLLARYFVGRYRLFPETTPTVLVAPNETHLFGEVSGAFGGALLSMEVAASSPQVDLRVRLDDVEFVWNGSRLTEQNITVPMAPNAVVTRWTPNSAPELVIALNVGSVHGLQWFDRAEYMVRNRGTSQLTLYETVTRTKVFLE